MRHHSHLGEGLRSPLCTTVLLMSLVLTLSIASRQVNATLLNVNFGQNEGPQKVGMAAAGQTANDFWNFYTRDDGQGGWRTFGVVANLKQADGTTTQAGVTVANVPGSWGTGSADGMYANYLYPFSGVATVTITNLNAGEYEVYVYAYDGNYELQVGSTSYGVQTCRDNAPSGVAVWQEGRQYVRYGGVKVGVGEAVTVTVRPGVDGYAVIAGMQLSYVAAPPPPVTSFLASVDFGAGIGPSKKVGSAAVGQGTNDYWNYYTRDGAGGWLTFGVLTNLTLAEGSASGVGLTIANAPGAWGTASSDAMYVDYIYPFGGNATIAVTNLPVGQYDFYLYGPDTKYELQSGGMSYGIHTNVDASASGTPVWQEGVQFSRYQGVVVTNSSQAVMINVQPGIHGYATLSGLQIASSAVFPSNRPPQILEQPKNLLIHVCADAIFSVVANGASPLSYQWLFNGTPISRATNSSYTITEAQLSLAGNYSVRVANAVGTTVSSNAALVVVQQATNNLLNINFGQDEGPQKVGMAALGQSVNDHWNFYTRDDRQGGWRIFGALANLKLADGASTQAGLAVVNAPGSWGMGSADGMYANYLYPFTGVATVTITNLIAGDYEVYIYAHDGNYELVVGGASYGVKTCRDNAPNGVAVWQEGRQYVRYGGVSVGAGEAVTLTAHPGVDGYAVIAGMQLSYVATPPPPMAAFLANVDFGAGTGPSGKVGRAAIGQGANDYWNYYTRDDGAGAWRTFGVLTNLTLAAGNTSELGLTIANAPGAWGTSSSDAMYDDYIYPFSGNVTIAVTNLPAGLYDFYLYGPDTKYELQCGGVSYGVRTNVDASASETPVWHEGVQYSHYRGVMVSNSSQAVVITAKPGIHGYATSSGLQIVGSDNGTTHSRSLSLLGKEGRGIKLRFAGLPAFRYRVEASTDMQHWEDLGCAISDNKGNCEFEDRDSTRLPQRYYRIVQP